ncbi:hypothetical protein BDR03DRAFT_974130 [Suillus americanus]|nr:hypothetical protein BDR03DRAFT_974130 [Suillus americanus]
MSLPPSAHRVAALRDLSTMYDTDTRPLKRQCTHSISTSPMLRSSSELSPPLDSPTPAIPPLPPAILFLALPSGASSNSLGQTLAFSSFTPSGGGPPPIKTMLSSVCPRA